MKVSEIQPEDGIGCFRDVPEYHDPVEPSFAPELRVGHLLDGRFLIIEALSRSGMAVIYKAQDKQDRDNLVAVKVPHLKYEADPNFFLRFQREEEVGLKLNHPSVLKFIPVERKSRPYIVMEYLRGCTLAHIMNAMRPLPEKDALRIGSLICDALQHLHERGVVHRDLKPGNVMICRDRTIRLMDFGLATDADARRITLNAFSPAMGTPDYMSPEQVRNQRGDARTDVYSLGVMLYEMLSGAIPFQNENPWVAMNDRVTGDPPAPRKRNPEISPEAEEIVLHAMQRDPGNRYPAAAGMKAELDSPRSVRLTGYCHRLVAPRWRFGLRETPILAGVLLGFGFISLQVAAFFFLRHFMAR